jgi:outer membrane receptor protein involved in Fe transport
MLFALTARLPGQATPAAAVDSNPSPTEGETVVLSPFVVSSDEDVGYAARSTLAGTRIRTDVKDVGSSISIITSKFLQDTNVTNQADLLVYTTNSEVAGPNGNFLGIGDSANAGDVRYGQTRIRGLVSADNTRNFYLTDIPWDSYNTGRVDIQRGPNSILFGIGSPAGIINASLNSAGFKNSNTIENQIGSFGTVRFSADFNRVLLDKELALRVALLDNDSKYKQEPTFRHDKRIYGALRWDPRFLNKGETTTSIEANFEQGRIRENLPRSAPPTDRLTPWFSDLQGFQTAGASFRTGGSTSILPGNEYLDQRAGDIITTGGRIITFQQGQQTGTTWTENIAGTNAYVGDAYTVGIVGYARWATRKQLPGYSINAFKERVITDPTIFDFYNNLLDGDTKQDYNNFHALNVAFRQNFGGDMVGYELALDEQKTHTGEFHFLDSGTYALSVDAMGTLPGGNKEFTDAASVVHPEVPDPLNPHLGQAYVVSGAGHSGFSWREAEKQTLRAQGYFNLDFNKLTGRDSIWAKVFGRNTFSGLLMRYRNTTTNAGGSDYYSSSDFVLNDSDDSYARTVYVVDYLAAKKLTGSSAHGINLQRLDKSPAPTTTQVKLWDSDALAFYSANMNTVVNSVLPEKAREYTGGDKQRGTIDSAAAVWQGYWFDGTIIPMFGIRKDRSFEEDGGSAPLSPKIRNMRYADVYSNDWTFGDPGIMLRSTSRTYSLVTHLPQQWRDRLPGRADVQLIFNQSQNFDPRPGRVDIYNRPLSNPEGKTKEYGIAFSALNDKVYLKIAHYDTRVANADIGQHDNINALAVLETWSRGSALEHMGYFGVPGSGDPNLWRAPVVYGYSSDGSAVTYKPHGPLVGQPYQGLLSGEPPVGTIRAAYTQAELDATWNLEKAANDAYLANPPPDEVLDALGISKTEFNDRTVGDPAFNVHANSVITGTTVSKGTEVELIANPVKGLDISINVSKTDARRMQMAQSYLDYITSREAIFHGPAGDIRFWSNGEDDASKDPYTTQGNGTARIWFDGAVLAPIQKFLALENSNVPELKPWAFNAIANYTFHEGSLKGLFVGGAYRWQDKNVTGFPVTFDAAGGVEEYDVAHPYYGPSEDAVDGWIGYQRRIYNKFSWRIRFGIRNILATNDLIVASVNPDGSPAAYRIPEPRTFTLTNTIEF